MNTLRPRMHTCSRAGGGGRGRGRSGRTTRQDTTISAPPTSPSGRPPQWRRPVRGGGMRKRGRQRRTHTRTITHRAARLHDNLKLHAPDGLATRREAGAADRLEIRCVRASRLAHAEELQGGYCIACTTKRQPSIWPKHTHLANTNIEGGEIGLQ